MQVTFTEISGAKAIVVSALALVGFTGRPTPASDRPKTEGKPALANLVLLSPPSRVTLCVPDASTERVTFAWRGAPGPYRIQIASDREFKQIVFESKGLSDNTVKVEALKPGPYLWRVGVGKETVFSEVSSLKIAERCQTGGEP